MSAMFAIFLTLFGLILFEVGFLGLVMMLEAFGAHIQSWISPVVTVGVVGYFFWRSINENRTNGNIPRETI